MCINNQWFWIGNNGVQSPLLQEHLLAVTSMKIYVPSPCMVMSKNGWMDQACNNLVYVICESNSSNTGKLIFLQVQESILPNFFLRKRNIFVLFFTIKLGKVRYRKYFLILQTLKLNNKNWKTKFGRIYYTSHSLISSFF
jgi:hypothetical protein